MGVDVDVVDDALSLGGEQGTWGRGLVVQRLPVQQHMLRVYYCCSHSRLHLACNRDATAMFAWPLVTGPPALATAAATATELLASVLGPPFSYTCALPRRLGMGVSRLWLWCLVPGAQGSGSHEQLRARRGGGGGSGGE